MNQVLAMSEAVSEQQTGEILKLAILAVGGQGGGVLTNWIEAVARSQGYVSQSTSVAGVAQRTGSTIYYVEMAPAGKAHPVFSLAPAAGDVDVLIASELMEAGRAIMRGFVTPERTTLIASSHRALAISEKMVPGDGIAHEDEVRAAADLMAKTLILADMESAARKVGSVISASLLGALAGSGTLPFPKHAYEEAIRTSGKGVEASLRAFAAGVALARGGEVKTLPARPAEASLSVRVPQNSRRNWQALQDRISALPEVVQDMAQAGLQKVAGFQSVTYGGQYLDHLEGLLTKDRADEGYQLSCEGAKYIANAMAYDDIIRVADLKTRSSRFAQIQRDMAAGDNLLHLTEYLHPRGEEIASLMPAALGRRLAANPGAIQRLDRWFGKGRRLRSDRLAGFVLLYLLGGLRGWRLRTYRHAVELEHLELWLSSVHSYLPERYDIAVELLRCRRLIKGYSDTHSRGMSKFDTVTKMAGRLADRDDAATWLARLREAALQDEEGRALKGAIKTIDSFL